MDQSNQKSSTLALPEDSVMRGILTKMDGKLDPKFANNTQVQDIDGGFFEKFGLLLGQKSKEMLATATLHTIGLGRKISSGIAPVRLAQESDIDNSISSLHDEIISQLENPMAKKESFIKEYSGLNSEELYKEILFELSNNVGSEDVDQDLLFKYVQDIFKVNSERHEEMLKVSSSRKPPEMRLNVEVIAAKELPPKDANGLSDPFVTMYLETAPLRRYNTSVQSCTLNPTWEEHFSIPLPDRTSGLETESLVVEVWDFDPAETIVEKLTSISDVKGMRGFRRLLKEITATAMNEANLNELIGRSEILLTSIPASGKEMWCELNKARKEEHQGSVQLRFSFSAEKNKEVATQEHTHLLRILLSYELEISRIATYGWCGKFSESAIAIITQHCAQSGITQNLRDLAQWSAYTTVHLNYPLAFDVFDTLLDKMQQFFYEPTIEPLTECSKLFWEGAKKLLPSCFSIIRNINKKMSSDKDPLRMLKEVLSILSKLVALQPPNDFDLFPKKMYGWINRVNEKTLDIHSVIDEAILSGAQDFLHHISEIGDMNDNDEENLRNLVNITQLVRADLQQGLETYDKLFEEKVQRKYTPIRFNYYSQQLTKIIQMTVENACARLKKITLPKHGDKPTSENGEVNMGTSLFELYLIYKEFASRRSVLAPDSMNSKTKDFHKWFVNGVAHWLDISVYKALKRIEKAIELDKLVPADDKVMYSTSAIDTLSIFYQIQTFWQQLDWPDIEGSYAFLAKIVDDICQCCVYYADTMLSRIQSLQKARNVDEKKFEVTTEWCLAINNIEHIKQCLPTFVKELKIEEVIEKLRRTRSPEEAAQCERTLMQLVANDEEVLKEKLSSLIESLVRKMCITMGASLQNAAENLHQDSKLLDQLMTYLEESLKKLDGELTETNFKTTLKVLGIKLVATANDIIQANQRRPPQFFANLRESLNTMVQVIDYEKVENCDGQKALEVVDNLLRMNSYETSDLIHEYYLRRYYQQQNIENMPHGQLTVRCGFTEDNNLEVEIMNARNLVPTSGTCDPYVQINLSPANKFGETTKYKTNVQNNTTFPLFDEKIDVPMSLEQRSAKNNLIIFCIKDRDFLGITNTFLSECIISFGEIEQSDRMQQKHLKLSRPTTADCDFIRVLERRQDDKQARDFIKKIKKIIS